MTALKNNLSLKAMLTAIAWLAFSAASASDIFEYASFKAQRFTETDGIISSETTDTYRDKHGFLWIATFSGLSRFDGRNFENYGREQGLTESNVDIVGEDAGGQLFFKSVTNIYLYTGSQTAAFIKFPSPGNFIITACPAGKGQVWLALEGTTGLHLYNRKQKLKTIATSSPVLKLVKAGPHIYVLEQNGQVSVLKNNTCYPIYTIRPKQPYTNEGIKIYKDANDRVWTYGANNTHLYAHKETGVADSIAVPASTAWWQWSVGGAGNVYLSSDSGSVFQLTGGKWERILSGAETKGHPYEVREDKNGIVWVSSSGGLLKLVRKQYQSASAQQPVYYYTTDNKGRYILCSDSLLFTLPNAVRHFYALQPKTVTNVYVTREKEVWYCTEEAVYFLPYGKPLQKLNTTQTYEANKAAFRFRKVLEDGQGGLWISSYHGIFYKRGATLQYYWDREGIKEGAIYTIAIDKEGIFYAAGVHVYAFINNRFQNISPQLQLPDEITRLTTDQNKALWICQGTNTVYQIGREKSGPFVKEDSVRLSLNELPFAGASMSFDAANNLWISDNRSLYCYRNNQYKALPLYWNERLASAPLLYSDDKGHLQVLSHPLAGNYLYTYHTGHMLAAFRATTPRVQLTYISLFKEAVDWSGAGFATDVLGIPQNLVLKHNQNFLRFHFTGLTDDYNAAIAYRYRLAGYDKAWSPATGIDQAEYTGLPAGSYTFEAQARSAGGHWSSALQYPFVIEEVWYRRWWAIALWVALALGLTAGLMYYRGQSLKRKAAVKQLLVEEQLKTLRAQINPHFLQNIFAFLAHELYSSQNIKAVKAIDRLSVYLRDVLKYSDKAAITLEEELEFADEYLRMQQELLSTSFDYAIQVDDEVDVFDIQVPSMLLQPLIENALKYGIEEGAANTIVIQVSREHNGISIVISDSGKQKTQNKNPLPATGKGIALTEERLKLFYSHKKEPPSFHRFMNQDGGCSAVIRIPLD